MFLQCNFLSILYVNYFMYNTACFCVTYLHVISKYALDARRMILKRRVIIRSDKEVAQYLTLGLLNLNTNVTISQKLKF